MGALRKEVRSDVRRAARMLIERYFREERRMALSKQQINALVKAAGKEISGNIVRELKIRHRRHRGASG